MATFCVESASILSGELMDFELTDKHGLQTEGRTEKGNPRSANHPNIEITENGLIRPKSRLPRLLALSGHLSGTMDILNQPKVKTGRSRLPCCMALSWQHLPHSKPLCLADR